MSDHYSSIKRSSNRSFGFVFTAFFAIIALWPLLAGRPVRIYFLILSTLLFLVSLISPRLLEVPNRWWARFGIALSRVTSPIAMGILFLGVVTPIGFVLRIFGKDLLQLKLDAKLESYWIAREKNSMTMIEQMKRPF